MLNPKFSFLTPSIIANLTFIVSIFLKDENKLCKLLVGDCKSYDILLETDPSLGKQVRINYAIFNSKDPLIEKRHEKEKDI